MAERSTTSNEMFWAFLWWLAALVAAIVVFGVLSSIVKGDPAAGIVFGGVTFVLVGLLLVFLGPGPKPSDEVATDHWHAAEPAQAAPAPAASTATAAHVAAPVAAPVHVRAEPVERIAAPGPDAPISERVRDAARAAGEAARAALAEAAPASVRPAALAAPAEGAADDLKKIKGVGPKLEELLHSLGIFHFGQVAGWGPAEVAWMDANLEGFQGRVTRDDWVGQSKLLASGGETEFSRRVDRGEVY